MKFISAIQSQIEAIHNAKTNMKELMKLPLPKLQLNKINDQIVLNTPKYHPAQSLNYVRDNHYFLKLEDQINQGEFDKFKNIY